MGKKALKEFVLYTYEISKLPASKKVRFVYLLKGRSNQDGIVVDMGGKFLVPGCFIIPSDKDKEMNDIFKQWEIKTFSREVIFK